MTYPHKVFTDIMPMSAEALLQALIVEDEALIAMAMEDLLVAQGFQVEIASTEADALQASNGKFPVAVADLRIGGKVTGQRVIAALRRHAPHLPVVVVTGFDAAAPEADLRGLGSPTVRLHKPECYDRLAAAVQEVIGRARLGCEPSLERRRRGDRPDQ